MAGGGYAVVKRTCSDPQAVRTTQQQQVHPGRRRCRQAQVCRTVWYPGEKLQRYPGRRRNENRTAGAGKRHPEPGPGR